MKKLKKIFIKYFLRVKKVFKIFTLKMFIFLRFKLKLKPNILSTILNGIGIGIIANVFFVIGTETKIDYIRLVFIAFFAIILLILSSIEKE